MSLNRYAVFLARNTSPGEPTHYAHCAYRVGEDLRKGAKIIVADSAFELQKKVHERVAKEIVDSFGARTGLDGLKHLVNIGVSWDRTFDTAALRVTDHPNESLKPLSASQFQVLESYHEAGIQEGEKHLAEVCPSTQAHSSDSSSSSSSENSS